MEIFEAGAISEWREIEPGGRLFFGFDDVEPDQAIRGAFEVMASGPLSVFVREAADDKVRKLVAVSRARFSVGFTARGGAVVEFEAREGEPFWVRGDAPPVVLPPSDTPAFTSIEPPRMRNPEVERMAMLMKANEASRQQQWQAAQQALAAMQAQIADLTAAAAQTAQQAQTAPQPEAQTDG